MAFRMPEQYRVRDGKYASDERDGNNGAFRIPLTDHHGIKRYYTVIASDGAGWEHVSVSLPNRTPSWEAMEAMRVLFWGTESTVMQLHVPRSAWVNTHSYTLHLWRPVDAEIPLPPSTLVGY